MVGWFIITMFVIWVLSLFLNVYYVAVGKKENFLDSKTLIIGAALEFGIAAGFVWLTPGVLTAFGVMLVAYYVANGLLDLVLAMSGGWHTPKWLRVVAIPLGLTFIVLTLTVGIVVV